MFLIESKLYMQNPNCKLRAFIRGAYIRKDIWMNENIGAYVRNFTV